VSWLKLFRPRCTLGLIGGSIARNGDDLLYNLPNIFVCWGRRAGNKGAHLLARWAFSQPNVEWLSTITPHIVSHIQTDIGFR
jgi:hypothetical protein